MSDTRLTRSDATALGLLALLVIAAVTIPWSRLLPQDNAGGQSKYALANIRMSPPKPVHSPPLWRADTTYSPQNGVLLVRLSHKHDAAAGGLGLRADFSPEGMLRPVAGAWLASGANGTYRSSGGLRLDKGEWTMSLTASEHSELLFRIEQQLRVE